ncbi:MAG: integrase catalytic subunit [uncultured bacterium]|nr:MAG: integrase catalytic subunit [uncultured bacterium]
MDFNHLKCLDDLKAFIEGSKRFVIKAKTIEDRYLMIEKLIDKFNYLRLSKKDKHIVLKTLKILTGYKKSQLHHLIDMVVVGSLSKKPYHRINIHRTYTGYDIGLLEETDELHYRLSAAATHEILRREYEIFGNNKYQNISHVSVSHINNLRSMDKYKVKYLHHTQARLVPIGETTKPEPNGNPGSIRIDTVFQSDICHINSVDEITQWEVIICVPQITERYLLPALEILLEEYPFIVFNFHSDRGGEYINYLVSHLLNKLLINQTKSRSRHVNDNALIEGKNGSVLRKNLGYFHINQSLVDKYNDFFIKWFNPYLNYHRPCGYITDIITDFKGRERKVYGQYTTPYEKLKEVSKYKKQNFLKKDINFEKFDKIAYKESDNEYTAKMRKQQYRLFDINNLLNARQKQPNHL